MNQCCNLGVPIALHISLLKHGTVHKAEVAELLLCLVSWFFRLNFLCNNAKILANDYSVKYGNAY